ncbi:MAG TPA: cytochrome c oxidase subunit II [Rhizomicrobium sp.]|nr:cytochrome c oxidase subunit II [Rhizomicrobium sp.]
MDCSGRKKAIAIAVFCAGYAGFPSLVCCGAQAAPLNYLLGHGTKAYPVVALTWGVLLISVAVIAIISFLVIGAIWRRPGIATGAPGTRLEVSSAEGAGLWIWIGVGISSLVLLASVVWTMRVLADVTSPSTAPRLTIEVTGRQWWWQVRYLSGDPSRIFTTANEIHIPTGVPVRFKLIGGDVIHSFWVPALSGKTDTIPGQTNETWMEAAKPGIYRGQCTEYCGVEHAHMGLVVVAQNPSRFQAWYEHQLQSPASAAEPPTTGQTEFNMHCGSCHAVRGTDAAGILGPDLSHLMTRRTIAAATLPNTPDNLTRWISDPQSVKPGAMMQRPELSDAELTNIRNYLQTLN